MKKRVSGVLMPVFSLPSSYGIGDFKSGYKFVDFLKKSGQSVWQVLPLVQTGFGNSPYSSICSYSFNPFFISVEELYQNNLISLEDLKSCESQEKYIDYGKIYSNRLNVLRIAFNNFDLKNSEFQKFILDKDYLDYAVFMTAKGVYNNSPFYEWDKRLVKREKDYLHRFIKENEKEVLFWQFIQFFAYIEWKKLKEYANGNGIKIFGDMPLYVASDSVDVWKNPSVFKLNKNYLPKKVAGVPPDYFCKFGQLWGNPVYDYKVMEKDGFSWWKDRLKKTLRVFDMVRIDHFRAFDRFYEIENGSVDARVGKWVKAPGKLLIDTFNSFAKKGSIIAEDLGIIDDGVRKLLKYSGYYGMKVLSFAFNGEEKNLYLPENAEENYVMYTGTHDNDTVCSLVFNSNEWDYNNLYNGVKKSLKLLGLDDNIYNKDHLVYKIKEVGFASKCNMFILPMQDVLGFGTDFRINEPGTVKSQNWAVKFGDYIYEEKVYKELFNLTKKYDRI